MRNSKMMRTIRRATRSMKSSKEKVETDGSGSATSSSQSLTRQLSSSNPELNCKDSNHRRTNSYPTRSSRDPHHHQMPRNLHKESLDKENTQSNSKDYVERSTQTENTLVLPKPMFSKKELKMPYFCCLYLLIGFNCCAFAHRISQTTVIHLIADLVCGLAVAVFLRRFVGLNLFKIQDKVTERAILTMVTQIRIAYYFIAGGLVYDWSLFLFVLSICILFLDYVPKSWHKIVLPFELKTE